MIRRARFLAAIAIALGLLAGQTPAALAGTTGNINGIVTDASSGRPLPDAVVTVTSPSQAATQKTDASGHYVFLSLAPDTYTIAVSLSGYTPRQISGIAVFADQAQTVNVTIEKSLRTIANVTSRSSLSAVKPGTTTDVYSVNAAGVRAAATLGGGTNLNSAYSALSAMPGTYVPPNQVGNNQSIYIRGGYYDQVGFEFDGVPVNRSFDNLPAHALSTLGEQELQVYTGGGPASANATGLSGFINQVIKTGTYPGFTDFSGRLGTPTFYHELTAEAGGANPARTFSYYFGLLGSNQVVNYLDNNNGNDLLNVFPYGNGPSNLTTFLSFYPAVYPNCDVNNPNLYTNPATTGANGVTLTADPGCFAAISQAYALPSMVADREAVANLHFEIPHKRDSGRDDIQLLYDNSTQYLQLYSGVNDAGAPLVNALVNCCNGGLIWPPHWPDFLTYPAGTQFLAPANETPVAYLFPGSPPTRCNNTNILSGSIPIPNQCPGTSVEPLSPDYRDGVWEQASIVKAQYQKNWSSSFFRVFGYTFYSNTNRSGASRYGIGSGLGGTDFDYEVDAHTRGAQMQWADQLTTTDQLSATLNYVTASTVRYFNHNYLNRFDTQVSNLTNGTQCFAAFSGYLQSDINFTNLINAGQPAPCNDPISQGYFNDPTSVDDPNSSNPIAQQVNCSPSSPGAPIPAPACAAGASWRLTYTGNNADINEVVPKFANFSLVDEWRPNPKLDVSGSIRFDRDEFDLTPINDAGHNFWFAAAQKEFCYDPTTLQPLIVPQPPQNASIVQPYVALTCPGTSVHPDGLNGHILLTGQFNPTYVQNYAEPRLGATYTVNPDTVLRLSMGRFAQEPQNYEIEYNSTQENLAAGLIGFLPFGFNTPRHDAGAQFSNNFDFSYEHQFHGTDMSIKVSPYYRYATQQLYESVSIPTLSISPAFNSGTERTDGVELEFTKGDFTKNGLSGLFSYTYTNSKEMWNNYSGSPANPVDPYNEDIQAYNQLTKACAPPNPSPALCGNTSLVAPPAPCYDNSGTGTPDFSCGPTSIRNPYYNMPAQPLLDKFGWYDTGLDFPYISPNTFALVLNYRHGPFAVTPAFLLNQGATYGSPADFQGNDPRVCTANQGSIGVTTGNPQNADYTSCSTAATLSGSLYIPNPYTGRFDSFGQFRQPWQFNMGLQMSYDITRALTANLTVTNLVNQCFGGSAEPWTAANPPSRTVCGYGTNTFYISNFYNGSSPNDTKANGVPLNPFFALPFVPTFGDPNGSFNFPLPMNVYFQLRMRV